MDLHNYGLNPSFPLNVFVKPLLSAGFAVFEGGSRKKGGNFQFWSCQNKLKLGSITAYRLIFEMGYVLIPSTISRLLNHVSLEFENKSS
jgi:hypothetical protein